jgi:mono/diheme cytochrome c family protein
MIRRHALNVGLLVALVVSLAVNWYIRRPAARPNVELAQTMAHGPRFDTFEPNGHFPNGMTLRSPVAGTIPRGLPPLGFGPSVVEGMRAGNELMNPLSPDDRAALERGGVVYERYCELCHAADGKGGGPVSRHGFRAPPTLHRPFARQMKDGQMFHIVTFGRGAMPGHAGQIPVSDRWKVVLHVRALQQREAGGAPRSVAGGE